MGETRRAIVFFSNFEAFLSSIKEPLLKLSSELDVSFTVCFLDRGFVGRDRYSVSQMAQDPSFEEVLFITRKDSSSIHPVVKFILGGLLASEIGFWRTHYFRLLNKDFQFCVIHSESFASDYLTSTLTPEEAPKILINTLNDLSENYIPARKLWVERLYLALRQFFNGRDFGENALLLALENLRYRILVPSLVTHISGRGNAFRPARRFVSGELADFYVLGPEMASRLRGNLLQKEFVSVEPLPEAVSNTEMGNATHTLLILSELPFGRKLEKYLKALTQDLALVPNLARQRILIRPHPRWPRGVTEVEIALRDAGYNVVVSDLEQTLVAECQSASQVIGMWSSALYEASRHKDGQTIGLLSPSLVEDPHLQLAASDKISWVPTEYFSPQLPKVETPFEPREAEISHVAERLSSTLETFLRRALFRESPP